MSKPLKTLPKARFDPALARGAPGFQGDWGAALWVRAPCANRCIFCHGHREPVEPSTLEEIGTLLPARGKRRLLLYGEPLLHPRILDIFELARERGFSRIEVQASGEELADRGFLRALARAGLASVSLPLYALGPLQDRIVGRDGSWARLERALDNLEGLRGVKTWVHSILLRVNLAALGAVREEARSRGFPFCVLPLHPKAEVRGIEKLLCSHREVVERCAGSDLELVGFPLCVLAEVNPKAFERIIASGREARKDYQRKVEKGISDITFGYTRMFKTVQPPSCRSCSIKALCPGVFPRQLERFGSEGLRPMTDEEVRR